MGGFSIGFMVLLDGMRLPLYVLTSYRLDDFFNLRRKSTTFSTAV
jgi:hypothetical protein